MRFLRFHMRSTKLSRLQTDKFALISAVWDRFIENSIVCYKPEENITVDKQLFPATACCILIQYMTNKSDKFIIKFWLVADVKFKYIPNAIPYFGKDEARPATQRLSESVIIKIVEPYLGKGRKSQLTNFLLGLILPRSSGKKDVTCRDPEQNPKGSVATGKSFTTEQILQ